MQAQAELDLMNNSLERKENNGRKKKSQVHSKSLIFKCLQLKTSRNACFSIAILAQM